MLWKIITHIIFMCQLSGAFNYKVNYGLELCSRDPQSNYNCVLLLVLHYIQWIETPNVPRESQYQKIGKACSSHTYVLWLKRGRLIMPTVVLLHEISIHYYIHTATYFFLLLHYFLSPSFLSSDFLTHIYMYA